jgi:lipoyl(octanoyl) transferase
MSYQEAWDYQRQLHTELVERKLRNKDTDTPEPQHHYLLMVEHPPVFTLGKSGSVDHLLLSELELEEQGFTFFKINRGGDITYHGPGQLVVYPIFDLDHFFNDLHRYIRYLEEAVIRTCADFGIGDASRIDAYTGVWLPETPRLPARKICAIGVHMSRWVSMHGLAFNINTDLSHFKYIVPCGIDEPDKDVTSLQQELGATCNMQTVKDRVLYHLKEQFDFELC